MLYSKEQTESLHQQRFAFLLIEEKAKTLYITLHRPEKKNALNPTMMRELAFAIRYAHHQKDVWAVVLKASGDVFCAGADLKGFSEEETASTIPPPDGHILLAELFRSLHKPCIAQVEGNVFAGGILLLAGCTHVIAAAHVQLGLPEVKRGLFPFQVLGSLLEIMPARAALDWCMQGRNIDARQALEWGLITQLCAPETLAQEVDKLLETLLQNSPAAIRLGLEAYAHIRQGQSSAEAQQYLLEMFMKAFQSKDAQEGIMAFREKRTPVWTNE